MASPYQPDDDATLTYKMEQWCVWINEACRNAGEQMGQIVTEEIKERLSEPYPPASTANTDPHLRTGALQEGIEYSLSELPEGIEIAITSSRAGDDPDVPMKLEFGDAFGNLEPRRYMSRAKEEWAGKGGYLAEEFLIPALKGIPRFT